MPSISATLQLSTSGLADLQAIPQQLQLLVNGAQNQLRSIHTGTAAGNPFSALLGNLQALAGQTANLPDLGPVLAPVQALVKDLPGAGFANIEQLTHGVDEMLGVFGPVKDLILTGKLDLTLEQGAQKALEVVQGLLKPGDESVPILGELEQFFALFRSLQSWDHSPPSAPALAEFLGQLFVGVPADVLHKPYASLRETLDPLRQVLPNGPELTAWRGAFQARSQFWGQANTLLAQSTIDWPGLEARLHGELQAMIDLHAKRDRLISVSLANLTSLNFSGLNQLQGAINAIARPAEFRIAKIMDGILSHIESLASSLENWAPTPEELQGLVNGLTGSFRTYLEESPLGELRALLLGFHHRLMLAIESLPFRDLAAKVEKALLQVAKAIDVVDPDLIRKPIHAFFEQIDAKIKEIPLAEIQNAINSVWDSVRSVFQQINTQLENLKNTLTGLVDRVKELVQQLQPTLDSVTASVETLKAQLDSFDLKEPAAVVVDELHKLRDTVAGIDFSKIPGPALSGLHAGAQLLRGLDVAAAVNPPLNEALGKVDPTPQLQSVTGTLSGATNNLRAIDPTTVVRQLDKPVDELLKVLNEFGPEKLKGLLAAATRPLEDALRQLDFARILAPVTTLFADLFAKVDAVLNPDLIFAPLDKLMQPVVKVIDTVKPSSLIAFATSQGVPISQATASAAHPPAAITNARAALQAIPDAPETAEQLFGYRPGDMLLPIIDIYRMLMRSIDRFSDELLGQVAQALQHNLTGRLRALLPSAIDLEVDAGLQVVLAEFEPSQVMQKLDESALAFQSFVNKFTELSAGLNPADGVVAGRIGNLLQQLDPLLLAPSPAQADGLVAASAQVKAGVRLDGIQNVTSQLIALESMFPTFLQAPQVTADALRQFLRSLDPAPIRLAINTAFDSVGQRIVALQASLMKGLDQLMALVEDFVLPITPGALLGLADQLHQAVKDQLLAFHPNRFKDELQVLFDIVKAQLKAFDPGILVEELNHQRDVLIQTLRDFVGHIQPDLSAFVKLQQDLAALKPSEILKSAVDSLKPVADLLGKIDVKIIVEPLIDAIARVRAQVPEVVAEIEAALDDVLNAIPEGGGASGSDSGSISIG